MSRQRPIADGTPHLPRVPRLVAAALVAAMDESIGQIVDRLRHHKLVEDTFESMRRGIAVVKPGAFVGDIGHAIQTFAEAQGHSVVRQFAGHGIGKIFHGPPTISHTGKPGEGAAFW